MQIGVMKLLALWAWSQMGMVTVRPTWPKISLERLKLETSIFVHWQAVWSRHQSLSTTHPRQQATCLPATTLRCSSHTSTFAWIPSSTPSNTRQWKRSWLVWWPGLNALVQGQRSLMPRETSATTVTSPMELDERTRGLRTDKTWRFVLD